MDPALRKRASDCLDIISRRMDEIEEQAARQDTLDRELEEELAHGNTMPVAPSAPFSDSPPEMRKEPLWNGHPPIPIEHL